MFVLKRGHGGNCLAYCFYFNAPHFLQAPWCCSRNHLFFRRSHAFCPCGQSSRCHVQEFSRGWDQCLACPRSVGGRIKLDARDPVTVRSLPVMHLLCPIRELCSRYLSRQLK